LILRLGLSRMAAFQANRSHGFVGVDLRAQRPIPSCIEQAGHQIVCRCVIIRVPYPEMRSARAAEGAFSKWSGLEMLDWTLYGNRFGGSGESQKDPAGPCLAHAAMACTR